MSDAARRSATVVKLPSATRRADQAAPQRPQPPLVPFAAWQSAQDRIAAAILGGATRILLTGPAGTGKSVLLDHVAKVLRAAGRTVLVQQADADPVAPPAGTMLFVDEADRLSDAKLRALLDAAGGAVLLAGLGTLARRAPSDMDRFTVAPLEREAARDYIAQWLVLTGRTTDQLDSGAVRRVVEFSGGVPRLLSSLLGAAAWLADGAGASVITAAHVDEAAELRACLTPTREQVPEAEADQRPRRAGPRWGLAATGVVVLLACGIGIAVQLWPTEVKDITERGLHAARDLKARSIVWLGQPSSRPIAPAAPVEPPAAAVALAEPAPAPPSPTVEPVAPAPTAEAPPPPKPQPIEPPAPIASVAPEPPPPPPVPEPVKPAQPALSPETVDILLRRGREMLALDDLSAARLLFSRAAEAGNADAMLALGRTYDPAALASMGAFDRGDLAEAMRWYARAADAGSAAAKTLLHKQPGP